MSYVVKVGDSYLQTLYWLLLTDAQQEAHRFDQRDRAHMFASDCRLHADYARMGVRVVKLTPSPKRSEGK